MPSRSVARRRAASGGASATSVAPPAAAVVGEPGFGAGISTRVPSTTTVTGTSEENVSTPSAAATRSADARVRVASTPYGRRGTSTSISGHESAATATATPFTTAVPGAVPRCGTPTSWPPPSRSRAEGDELVGKSAVTGTPGTVEVASASLGPRVSITRANT